MAGEFLVKNFGVKTKDEENKKGSFLLDNFKIDPTPVKPADVFLPTADFKTGGMAKENAAPLSMPASKAGAHRTRGMTIVPEPRLTGVNPGTRPTGTVQSIRHSNKAQNNNPSWMEDMFAQDRNYIDLIKEGDIAGATANFIGTGIQGAQSFYLNGINAIDAAAHGEKPTFIYNMDKATYDKQVANRRGVEKTIGEKISDFNTGLGIAYSIVNEGLSDPMELFVGGFYNDLSKSLGAAKPGSINYGEAMKAGKMIPKDGLNISPDAWKENDPILKLQEKAVRQKRYMDQINAVMHGENMRTPITVGNTPDILQKYGASNNVLIMRPTSVRKIAYPEGYMGGKHNLGFYALEQLPTQLENPVAILKSATQPDSLVIFTEFLDANGYPVMVPIHLNKQGVIGISNEVTSMYGRKGFENFIERQRELGNILFEDKKRTLQQLPAAGLQLPGVEAASDPIFSISENAKKSNPVSDDPLLRAAKGENPFGKNTVGAAQTNPVSYEHLQNQFGTIPPGELPRAREVDVPLQTAEGNRVRQFTRTAMEAPATPDELIGEFEKGVARGEFSYTPKKDKDSLGMAVKTITDKGYNGALAQWEDVVEGRRAATKGDIVLAQMLYAEAAKAGDTKTAMKLAAEIAAEGTRAGQNVQALRLLKKMTPQGQLYYAERSLQNLQQDLLKRFGEKAPKLSIDEDLVQQLLNARGEKAVEWAFDKIAKNIADQIPSSWADKWNAWRYLSMLGNPRTHVRNIIGNAVFTPVRKLKNLIGAGLENVTDASLKVAGKDGIVRTKAVSLPFVDTKIKEYGAKDFDDIKNVITGTGKYNPTDLIQSHKTVFNNRFLEWLRKANEGALDAEDVWFMKNAYVDSFTQYIKANGLDVRTLEKSAEGMQKLGEARKYAILEAQKATFRDANKLADALAKLENTNKFTKVTIGGLLPFKKTPANIVKRGLEYSPAGLVKGLTYDLAQVKKGTKTAAEAIDQIASGLSGTGIALLGGYLASKGILTGAGSSDKKERTFDRLQGSQNYALNIGDVSYTLDWAAPAALPLFVGVESWKAAKAANRELQFTDFADALTNITEPIFDMTMLQGVNSAIQAAGYDPSNSISGVGKQVLTNYLGQATPTILGQLARTIDGTRRTVYDNKNNNIPKFAEEFVQRQAAKFPGASYLLQPYVDAWGRESEKKPIGQRAFENFLSPGYISKRNVTPADQEIGELYQATGDRAVLPSVANKDFNVDNEKLNLTARQYTDFSKARGQTAKELIEAVAQNGDYKQLDYSDQVDIITDIYDYANAFAKTKVSGYQLDGWIKKAYDAQQKGIPLETYLVHKSRYNSFKPIQREGKEISGTDQYREYLLKNKDLTAQEKEELDRQITGNKKTPDYSDPDAFRLSLMSDTAQKLYSYSSVREAVGSMDNFIKLSEIMGSIKADKDEYGNAINGSSKLGAIETIASTLAVSRQKAERIYNEVSVFDHDIADLSTPKRESYEALSKMNLSAERFLNYYNQTKIIEGSKDKNGKTISGSQKENRRARLREMGLTDAQARKFLEEVYDYSKNNWK